MYNYNPYVSKRDVRKTANKSNWFKNLLIGLLTIAVVLLLGVVFNLKRAYSLREYAIANDCEWIYQNTAYGDDRDYICK